MTPSATIRNSDSSVRARPPQEPTMATCWSRSQRPTFDRAHDNRERILADRGRGGRTTEKRNRRENRGLAIGKRRKRRFPPLLSDSRWWKRCLDAARCILPHFLSRFWAPVASRRVVGNKSALRMLRAGARGAASGSCFVGGRRISGDKVAFAERYRS